MSIKAQASTDVLVELPTKNNAQQIDNKEIVETHTPTKNGMLDPTYRWGFRQGRIGRKDDTKNPNQIRGNICITFQFLNVQQHNRMRSLDGRNAPGERDRSRDSGILNPIPAGNKLNQQILRGTQWKNAKIF